MASRIVRTLEPTDEESSVLGSVVHGLLVDVKRDWYENLSQTLVAYVELYLFDWCSTHEIG